MSPAFHFQLARSIPEFEAALELLQWARQDSGFPDNREGSLWLLKQHALPASNTVIALHEGEVVGALCLFGDSPLHLPLEERLDLKSFRLNLEGRLVELSIPALTKAYAGNKNLLLGLYHFALCFGATYCNYNGFVTEAPATWAKQYAELFGFSPIYESLHERQMLFLHARDVADLAKHCSEKFEAHFQFPEQKFFLVAHQNMCPTVLNHLFNKRTQLFESLGDADLRVLKNVYDWGEYARILPERALMIPEKKASRFPRFPMNCEGFLVNEQGAHENVQLLDVSREGLKIRIEQVPDKGCSYVLTLFVGVNRKTELIAQTVWIDKKAAIAGFEIRSSDREWTKLLAYLERDFLRVG